jgi:hypothetical protein
MQICKPDCVTTFPGVDWGSACNITTRDGGIPRLTFLVCDPAMTLPYQGLDSTGALSPSANQWTNPDNIKWAICNGFLKVTGELVGQKPKGSFTKRRLSSCAPETTVSGTKTVTFNDFNADKETLIDYDFWQAVTDNKQFLFFGFITCDDRWYQHPGSWDIELDEVIEDTGEGKSFYDGTITMVSIDLIKPIYVPGLNLMLKQFASSTACYS